jgi:GMP synthase-like glutamine amidotransferase
MKILLVNNHTQHLQKLSLALAGHDVEVQNYQPGLDFHHQDKDLVILSGGGGEGVEIDDHHAPGHLWYEDQMTFVLQNDKPLIGICMGFEVICRAFGESIPKMPGLLEGTATITTTKKGLKLWNKRTLSQHEAHQWHVTAAPKGFEVLADSAYGVEIIRRKNIIATQFHPEFPTGSIRLNQLLQNPASI